METEKANKKPKPKNNKARKIKKASKAKKPRTKTIDKFELILIDIAENNLAVRDAVKKQMSFRTFYDLLKDEEKVKQYARACEIRADKIADEILDISDATENDVITDLEGKEIINHNIINRDRLRVDARKWLLSKMNPKKYGDKLQLDNKINVDAREAFKALFPTQEEIDAAG
jgi:hypothetical protein